MSGISPAPAGTVRPAERDGRRLRRDRNRLAVVDALLDLYRDGNLQPSTTQIAERAGLSSRSLFRYFDDIDDLCRTAVRRQQQRALPLVPIDAEPGAPVLARIEALVAQRLRLFDAVGPAATVSRLQSPFQPVLAAELTRTRAFFRDQIRRLFAAEIAGMGTPRSGNVLAAADVLCSFESYQLLRHDQKLSGPQAKAALVAALAALLADGLGQ